MLTSRLLVGLPLLQLTVGLCGCGARVQTPEMLIYGRGGDADGLDPIHTDVGETVKVLVNLYDTLVTYDDRTLDIVPSLATKWETSADGRTWTFHLREGVKFHDGTTFDAEAVRYSFARITDDDHPDVYSEVIPFEPTFEGIERIEIVDPLTIRFHLKRPDAVFLENLCMYAASIVSPTAVKKWGPRFAIHPVGTGPFRFVHWDRDEQLILDAFDAHWRGPPGAERVVFVPVSESAVRAKQLERGEIHIADNLPPATLDALAELPQIVVQSQRAINVAYLTMQTQKPPLDNVKLRRAIWRAIDKEKLIRDYFGGHAEPAVNMMPPTLWGYNDAIEDRAYDLDRARQLVKQAQAEEGFALPLELDLFVMDRPRPYLQLPRETAVFIKDQLKKIDIDVRIVTSRINEHFRRLSNGEHDLGLAGWLSDNGDPDNFLYVLLNSQNIRAGGTNHSQYKNAEVDRLTLAAKRELDREKRAAMYRRVQEIVFADAPAVPLAHTTVRVAQRKELKGYYLHPGSLVRLRNAYFE
jgi:peptide/nickel transport system substrate-binding protein